MADAFLSQEEVDALLKGVTGEADDAPAEEVDPKAVRSYNLATQERIVRGRMPTLEIINERFARLIRIGLYNFLRRNVEISVGPVRVSKYSEFIRNLVVPTNLNLVQFKPLRGTGLMIFNPDLVFLVVDNLFGGDGRFHTRIEGRDFTQTEHRIIQRMLAIVFESYAKSWEPIYPLEFEFVRSEMNTQFANIASPTEVVIVSTFSIELGSGGGAFHVCIPYSTLEPIRDLIYSPLQGDNLEPDRRWIRMLSRQVQGAEVDLAADIASRSITVRDLLAIKVGDVLDIELPPRVEARVDDVPVFECSYGTLHGQIALRVEKLLPPEKDPPAS